MRRADARRRCVFVQGAVGRARGRGPAEFLRPDSTAAASAVLPVEVEREETRVIHPPTGKTNKKILYLQQVSRRGVAGFDCRAHRSGRRAVPYYSAEGGKSLKQQEPRRRVRKAAAPTSEIVLCPILLLQVRDKRRASI
ncbi:hypothetical protein NDU88_001025 [Pleurodeles waltl]|uniref:Uncharacterized protein n=1 Tax=Pleurodeles waltl TaxID=8319 RepID=A0AAV7VVR8_PLEWA|nr:hypothetical protein NDU88_001025 [Pleurodeles waltl]